MRDWVRPVEYNWRGERLVCAHVGQLVDLKPMGPNSPSECTVVITNVDEVAQTVTLQDEYRDLVITWDDWCWFRASPHLKW
jgi:hypothetical protein